MRVAARAGGGTDATVTLDRAVLDAINLHEITLEAARERGFITFEGDAAKVQEFVALLDDFDFWFDMVTP